MNYENLTPLGANVLVYQNDPALVTGGGIVLPEATVERPPEAVVVALGAGPKNDPDWEGFEVNVGETVLLERFGGTDIGDGWKIVPESAIIGVLVDEAGRQLYPVGRLVVVAILPPEERSGRIFLPERSREAQEFGVVKVAAERCRLVAEDDYAFVSREQGTHFLSGGVDHIVIDERKLKATFAKGGEEG